jgi:hypothetical protein
MTTQRIDDGGAAFPANGHVPMDDSERGMSLRDYFAGQALAALFAAVWNHGLSCGSEPPQATEIAKTCYLQADAMLRVRGEGKP